MKYITVPQEIKIVVDGVDQEVVQSFQDWLSASPLNSKEFGASGKTLRMAVKLESRFSGKVAGSSVPVEDEEWEVLSTSVENPEGGFNTRIAKLFLPFMDAVSSASETEPPVAVAAG